MAEKNLSSDMYLPAHNAVDVEASEFNFLNFVAFKTRFDLICCHQVLCPIYKKMSLVLWQLQGIIKRQ